MTEKNTSKDFKIKLLLIACFICNISQLPTLMGNGIIRGSYHLLWISLFGLIVFKRKKINIDYLKLPIIFIIIMFLQYAMTQFQANYFKSNLFQPVLLCTFILMIGFHLGLEYRADIYQRIALVFIVSSLIVAAYIYMNVFRGADWAGTGGFLYSSKNSAGQIFLTSITLIIFFYIEKNKILSFSVIVFFSSIILMMKSRATIISFIGIILYFVFFVIKKKLYKFVSIIIIIAVTIWIFTDQEMYKLFIEQIMLNNKEIDDITGISSSRDLHYEIFKNMFPSNMLMGTGGTYLESFPLATLLSYGLIGGIPLILYSLYPMFKAIKCRPPTELIIVRNLIIALNIMMWFNGIFEEQSPFGPGVKCYFLWLLTGLYLGMQIKMEKEKQING